ncbi:MAG: FtsK/SpoIIIE domain-containing protein [Actinomycetales bacterium]
MHFTVEDRRDGTAGPRTTDVVVTAAAPDATVADVVHAVSGTGGRGVPVLDGEPARWEDRLTDLPLHVGSVLAVAPDGAGPTETGVTPASRGHGLVDLVTLAGPATGLSLPLAPGSHVLGRSRADALEPGRATRSLARIDVADPPTLTALTAGVRLDGEELPSGATAPLDPAGSTLASAGGMLRIRRPFAGSAHLADVPAPDVGGRRPLTRTPRISRITPPEQVEIPEPPRPAREPQPLSWIMLIAPVPIGIVLALVFSPLFLLMTAMTPMMVLARWVEGRMGARRDRRRIAAETAAAEASFAADLDDARARASAAARAGHPDLAELAARAATGHLLWEVRPGDPDELRAAVGTGDLPWTPDLAGRRETLRALPGLADAVAARPTLPDVPVLLALQERPGVAIVGPAGASRWVAAGLLLDLLTRHGPADLALALVVAPGCVPEWDWAKWLPHLLDETGVPQVAVTEDAAVALLQRLADPPAAAAPGGVSLGARTPKEARGTPRTLVVVDAETLLSGRVASLLGRATRHGARAVVLARRPDQVPAACRWLVELAPDGRATVTDAGTGQRTPGVVPIRAAAAVCHATARALGAWADPEKPASAAALPDRARLADLLPGSDLLTGWRADRDGLHATLGVTEQGPLILDLLTDGPHGLVVGTTGSGKSELLRTLVASLAAAHSPDRLTFLLVDFKGGGAFDACAGLPHTVGLVTDLDEHLAARALRCLRAELRHREHRLREAGVSDLRDYHAPSPPLPRLLIVIDEFATLAVELPGFLSALVDVAQRGRSLGIHLLLATQRPQGVVDGKIRSNTNLRIALRVQDDADSRDVIGTRQAADVGRRQAGRGFVRLGAAEVVAFQAALVSGTPSADAAGTLDLRPFRLVPEAPVDPRPTDRAPAGPTDLELLVAEARAAASAGGHAAPRVPWPAPLPTGLAAAALPAPDGDGTVPLGIADLPDEQRTATWSWRPEGGPTLVLGATAPDVADVLATACTAVAGDRGPDRLQLLVLDALGGLGPLAALPHAVAVVATSEGERLGRVLDHVETELAARRAAGAAPPGAAALLVVVAGWGAVVEAAEQAGIADAGARLERLLRDGPAFGVHVLAAAPHERALPGRVLAQVPRKIVMELADPSSYAALGLRVRDLPTLRGLRAVEVATGVELQLARHGDDPAALAAAVARVAATHPGAAPATTLGVLAADVDLAEVARHASAERSVWRLPVGRRHTDLGVACVALAPGTHLAVTGPAGSGRTTALRTLASGALLADPAATVAVIAVDPDEWRTLPGVEVGARLADLQSWPPDGRGLLLVDGVEELGPAVADDLDRAVATLAPGCHLAVGGRAEAFRGLRPWQRTVTATRTGILLRPGSEDGDVLRVRLPRGAPPRPLPGRGFLVDGGRAEQVQVARTAEPARPGLAVA